MAVVNHFNRTVDAIAPTTKFPRLKAFLSSNIWPWICSYLRYVFERKFPFPGYDSSQNSSLYHIAPLRRSDTSRLSIAGDWATGTDDSDRI